jgi:methyl-accepting chemotaxis protein
LRIGQRPALVFGLIIDVLMQAQAVTLAKLNESVAEGNNSGSPIELISEIATASQNRREGLESVNQTNYQIDATTRQNSVLVEQVAAASLKAQAATLEDTVSLFRVGTASP